MDPDTIEELYSYFKQAETDDLEMAVENLPDFTETEIDWSASNFFGYGKLISNKNEIIKTNQ